MPFDRPSLTTLIARAEADVFGRIEDGAKTLRRAVLRVLARVLAGLVHGLYGFLAWIFKQLFPDTAEGTFLDRWAGIWGVKRKAATFGVGAVTIAGTAGRTLPAGTLLQRADGWQYVTTAEADVGTAATVEALVAGVDGNCDAGVVLSLVSPVSGIEADLVITATGITGGTDKELDPALLARLLARIQAPPHGGAKADYAKWAKEVAGVTRAWMMSVEDEPGHIRLVVFVVMDNKPDTIIPTEAELGVASAYIDTVRPVTAEVTTTGPAELVIAPQIRLTPATASVKAAVTAEWQDLIRREAEPNRGGGEGRILLSHIREAISIAAGEEDHELIHPTETIVPAIGEMVIAGDPVWVE